jgi:extracellular elastinolytic metalloproteinase
MGKVTRMRKNILRYAPLALVLLSGCAGEPDLDPGMTEKVTSDGTRILRSDTGPLTRPSSDDPATIATDFLLLHTAAARADNLTVASQTTDRDGVTHVRIAQTAGGLRVHGAYSKIAISADGEVLQTIERLAPPAGKLAPPRVSERDALAAAMAHLGYAEVPEKVRTRGDSTDFALTKELYREPSVERVAYFESDGSLRAGFLVETWSKHGNELDHTLVDENGAIVSVELRTNNDSYKVFAEDPLKGGQTVVSGPGAGNAESPAGWLGAAAQTTANISGNNVRSYLDIDANNAADSGGTAVSDGNFVATVDLGQQPSVAANRAVAVQNLFYLNNVIHDRLYQHGFNETAGNFQVNNFGKGGAGNDAVNAEAQDGSGTDNANFATPSDGSSPRMQMYLWTGTTPGGLVTVNAVDYGAYGSVFGPALTVAGVTGQLAIYNDGSGVTSDACQVAVTSLSGKVAVVDRGTCDFTVKVLNAQKAGALGVIIANNVAGNAFSPGGTNNKIKIPSGMVSQADGATLKALAGQSSNLRKNPAPILQVDGDLDADIVFHEYGHGLSWRMIGGMSGKLAGALGEGASDVTAFLSNGDDRIGEYSYGDPLGIRRYPYASHPLTYSGVAGASVHDDGEIYAASMWRVLQNYLAAGYTAEDLFGDFVDGMNYTPSTPAFEDMRDGMLQSAAGTGRECLIWKGFAAGGIGVGANGAVSPNGAVSITESFTVPANCQ